MKKRSFFERLTGAVNIDDIDSDEIEEESSIEIEDPLHRRLPHTASHEETTSWQEEPALEGELTVDVFQNADEIIIKTMVAGVLPDHLDISATRDVVTIRGHRETEKSLNEDDYFHRELYWGSFSRTIMLPVEVEPEEAEVEAKHGLLTIKLPKINKGKQTKLKVKSS